jgi:hypothetical protein
MHLYLFIQFLSDCQDIDSDLSVFVWVEFLRAEDFLEFIVLLGRR